MSEQQPEQDRTEQLTEQERESLLLASDDLTDEEVEAIRASQEMPTTPPPDDPDVS